LARTYDFSTSSYTDFLWTDNSTVTVAAPWLTATNLINGPYASMNYASGTNQQYWDGQQATDNCAVMCMSKSKFKIIRKYTLDMDLHFYVTQL